MVSLSLLSVRLKRTFEEGSIFRAVKQLLSSLVHFLSTWGNRGSERLTLVPGGTWKQGLDKGPDCWLVPCVLASPQIPSFRVCLNISPSLRHVLTFLDSGLGISRLPALALAPVEIFLFCSPVC